MFSVIIPLRAGSKGLKHKNIKKFSKDNLVNHTIKKIQKIREINKIFILTDSIKYKKKILVNSKINLDFPRSKKLSNDDSSVFDLVNSFIKWTNKKKYSLENIILMQVTSPLLSTKEIKDTLKFIQSKKIESLFHVTEMIENPHYCILGKDKKWQYILKQRMINRQKSKKFFFITGSLFFFTKKFFLKNKKFINTKSFAFQVSKKNFIDIDDNFTYKLSLAAKNISV